LDLMIFIPVVSALALLFAFVTAKRLMKEDSGEAEIVNISTIIRKAAQAFLRKQYMVVAIFFAIVAVLLLLLNLVFDFGSIFTPFAFLSGGVFSGLYGYIGMHIATSSNGRTVVAARRYGYSALIVRINVKAARAYQRHRNDYKDTKKKL